MLDKSITTTFYKNNRDVYDSILKRCIFVYVITNSLLYKYYTNYCVLLFYPSMFQSLSYSWNSRLACEDFDCSTSCVLKLWLPLCILLLQGCHSWSFSWLCFLHFFSLLERQRKKETEILCQIALWWYFWCGRVHWPMEANTKHDVNLPSFNLEITVSAK